MYPVPNYDLLGLYKMPNENYANWYNSNQFLGGLKSKSGTFMDPGYKPLWCNGKIITLFIMRVQKLSLAEYHTGENLP